MEAYPPGETLQGALQKFFAQYNLGEDGGLNKNWAWLNFGWFSIPFPNTASRKRALMFHDMHHIVTGYKSNWKGEAAIGAWEVSSGCGDFYAAWLLDIWAMALGLLLWPRYTFKAFIRGQRSRNLYVNTISKEQAMQMQITQLRQQLLLHKPVGPATGPEVWAFIKWSALALVAWFIPFGLPYVLLGWWLLT